MPNYLKRSSFLSHSYVMFHISKLFEGDDVSVSAAAWIVNVTTERWRFISFHIVSGSSASSTTASKSTNPGNVAPSRDAALLGANNMCLQMITNKCRLIEVSLGGYIRFYTFFWPAEFPGYHQWQQESQ